jgi:hypothetical protein
MRRILAVVVLAALATLMAPQSAQGGGPTSVIVTDPMSGEASALYYTDKRYAELERLLSSGTPVADPPSDQSSATTYNLTWLIHDVTPWRVDQVYFDVPGGPWVATRQGLEEGLSDHVAWRRVSQGKALSLLLEGLLGAPASTSAGSLTTVEPAERVVEVTRTETTWFSLSGWRWVAPGLLLGLAIGLLTARRAAGRLDEPRQVLVDRERVGARL